MRTPLGPKAPNARKGIKTHQIQAGLDGPGMDDRPKAPNARKGIKTHRIRWIPDGPIHVVRKPPMPERALRPEREQGLIKWHPDLCPKAPNARKGIKT